MTVELIRYSQDVDINDPSKATSFLVLRTKEGREFRVRVTDETIRDLVLELDQAKPSVPPTMVVDETRKEPGEDEPYYQDDGPQRDVPESGVLEDGVPSL